VQRPVVAEPETRQRIPGLALPRRTARLSSGRMIWFAIAFIAPVVLGALYLFAIMPDQYVTEFRFSVRVPVGNSGAMAQSGGGSAVSALFGGNPTPGTDLLDNFTVADYARSAQAARDINAKLNLKAMYSKPGDPFSRLGESVSQERLGRYWKWMVYSDYDVTTGLAVVRVRAYSAADSLAIANTLLALSNQLVNDIGNQSQGDTVRFAHEQEARANQTVTDLRHQIAALSARGGIDSPSVGVIQANTQVATTTRTNIAQIQSEIEVLERQLHNTDAPQIVLLHQELDANQRALENAVRTTNVGPTNAFADLNVQLTSAIAVLSTARASLSNAEAAASAQRLYLTTYVRPALPESSVVPNRWLDLLLLVMVAAMVWVTGMLVRNSIMEHGL
jgi:capsular polysaccharide transport system permease protein